MNNQVECTIDCLSQLIALYGQLLEEEVRVVEHYLSGSVEAADRSRREQGELVERVRYAHRELGLHLSDFGLSGLAGSCDRATGAVLERKRDELNRLVAELQLTIRRNHRYIQNSLACCQGILQHSLSDMSCYRGDGFLKAPGHSLHGGVRA